MEWTSISKTRDYHVRLQQWMSLLAQSLYFHYQSFLKTFWVHYLSIGPTILSDHLHFIEAFSWNICDIWYCQQCPARVVYKITCSAMKTLDKELGWERTQWLHKLWACAKSIIQYPNENLRRMITFSGRTQTRPVDCRWRVLVAI